MRFAPILRARCSAGRLPRRRGGRAVRLRARRPGLRGARHRLPARALLEAGTRWLKRRASSIREIELYERPVRLRLPFRFGVVTLTECPQAFVRARIELADGRSAVGRRGRADGAEVVRQEPRAEQRGQLRAAARRAAHGARRPTSPMRRRTPPSATSRATTTRTRPRAPRAGCNPLLASYGPALIDRALLDALCRALGVSFYAAVRGNLVGLGARHAQFAGFDWDALPGTLCAGRDASTRATRSAWSTRSPRPTCTIRSTMACPRRWRRWWPATAIATSSSRSAGDIDADLARLTAIAAVLDRSAADYFVSLDGNEQYRRRCAASPNCWRAHPRRARAGAPAGARPCSSSSRSRASARSTSTCARSPPSKPVIIDESDGELDTFVRGTRARLPRRLEQDLQGPLQVAAQRRALRRVERGAARHALLHVRRRPHDAGRPGGAAGPGAGEPARHHARRAQRPPLRQRHGRAARGRAAGFPAGAPRSLRAHPRRRAVAHPRRPHPPRIARLRPASPARRCPTGRRCRRCTASTSTHRS